LAGEVRGQLDVLALHGAEAGQAERDDVDAWPQVHNLVLAFFVGHDTACLFDERRARRLHCDTGHDGASGVLDDSGNTALRGRGRWKQSETGDGRKKVGEEPGIHSLLL